MLLWLCKPQLFWGLQSSQAKRNGLQRWRQLLLQFSGRLSLRNIPTSPTFLYLAHYPFEKPVCRLQQERLAYGFFWSQSVSPWTLARLEEMAPLSSSHRLTPLALVVPPAPQWGGLSAQPALLDFTDQCHVGSSSFFLLFFSFRCLLLQKKAAVVWALLLHCHSRPDDLLSPSLDAVPWLLVHSRFRGTSFIFGHFSHSSLLSFRLMNSFSSGQVPPLLLSSSSRSSPLMASGKNTWQNWLSVSGFGNRPGFVKINFLRTGIRCLKDAIVWTVSMSQEYC